MRFSLIFIMLIVFLLPSCVQIRVINPRRIDPEAILYEAGKRVDAEEISRVVIIYAQQVKKKYKHLILEDSQAFFEGKKLKRIQLEFSTQNVMELKEARDLLVDTVDELLARLNDEVLITEAAGGELDPCNLDVYINFESYYGLFVDPTYIGFMSLRDGIVSFYAFDWKECYRDCWKRRLEYYWQSRNIVMFEKEAKWIEEQSNAGKSALENERYRISNKEAVQGTIQAKPFDLSEKTYVPKPAIPMGESEPILQGGVAPTAADTLRPKKETPITIGL